VRLNRVFVTDSAAVFGYRNLSDLMATDRMQESERMSNLATPRQSFAAPLGAHGLLFLALACTLVCAQTPAVRTSGATSASVTAPQRPCLSGQFAQLHPNYLLIPSDQILIPAFDMEALKKYVRVPHVTVSVVGYFLPIRLPRLA